MLCVFCCLFVDLVVCVLCVCLFAVILPLLLTTCVFLRVLPQPNTNTTNKHATKQTHTHTHINNDSSFVFCLHVCCLFCLFVSLLMLCSGMLGRVESFIGSVGLFVCALFVWEGWYGVVCDCWMLRLDVVRV